MTTFWDIIAHCRFGMSHRVAPLLIFTLSMVEQPLGLKTIEVAIIFLVLLSPSCCLYNGYWDKDEGPVGCLEKPPPVTEAHWLASLFLDILATTWSYFSFGPYFAFYCIIYALAHRAYSHPAIRLKGSPIGALLIWNWIQGYVTVLGIFEALSPHRTIDIWSNSQLHYGGMLMTFVMFGIWPIYQIYQHEEDAKNGEFTLSMWMGVEGTMLYVFVVTLLSGVGHLHYFWLYLEQPGLVAMVFLTVMLPNTAYFLVWWGQVLKNSREADFKRTMTFTRWTCSAGILFYTWLTLRRPYNGVGLEMQSL